MKEIKNLKENISLWMISAGVFQSLEVRNIVWQIDATSKIVFIIGKVKWFLKYKIKKEFKKHDSSIKIKFNIVWQIDATSKIVFIIGKVKWFLKYKIKKEFKKHDSSIKIKFQTTLPTGTGYDCAFSSDGTYLCVAHSTTPYVTIYKRAGDVFTKLADPDKYKEIKG